MFDAGSPDGAGGTMSGSMSMSAMVSIVGAVQANLQVPPSTTTARHRLGPAVVVLHISTAPYEPYHTKAASSLTPQSRAISSSIGMAPCTGSACGVSRITGLGSLASLTTMTPVVMV